MVKRHRRKTERRHPVTLAEPPDTNARQASVWEDVPEAIRATVRVRETIEPVPEWVERYREQRVRFRALYPAVHGLEFSANL